MEEKQSNWISEEQFICEYCSNKFRYAQNLRDHYKECLEKRFGVPKK